MNRIKKRAKQIVILLKFYYYKTYCVLKKIKNDDMWIIAERGFDARDNGIHFFEYIRKNHPEIKIKYVINKNSPDYEKVREIGPIVEYGSKEHYILFITAPILISTHIMGFSPDEGLFSKLCTKKIFKVNGKFIFLQHGIIKDFLNSLVKEKTNLAMFVSSAQGEYKHILENYGYNEDVVKLTGLARYDKLRSNNKKQILIMPTFRKWLSNSSQKEFIKTNYYNCYSSLLNNKKLAKFLNENNFKLYFYPHYVFQKYIECFKSNNENIIIADMKNYDVQKLLIESDILITDFSSVFFDFAYMKKPVIYYQFDEKEYRQKHYNESYFIYKRDGFGPVVYNEDEVIEYLQHLKNRNYKIENNYKEKIENFFLTTDTDNCKRIFKEIMNIYNEKVERNKNER